MISRSRKLLEELHAEQSKNNQYRQDGLLTGGNNPFPRYVEGRIQFNETPRYSTNEYNSLKHPNHELENRFMNMKQELEKNFCLIFDVM